MSPGNKPPFNNPGWAGNTGDFDLSEEQVRGIDFIGERPLEGGHPAGAPAFPFMLADKDPEAPLFEGPYRERFDKILGRYPDKRAALLPVLNLAEEVRGHVSPETMDRVAELLELPDAYVRGVTTFYTMYNKAPVGRYLVQVCTNISCNLCGAEDVLAAFLRYTDTEMGETSEDGLFTVIEVECLAACGFPTCVQINSRYYENVTPDDVPAILERLKSESRKEPPGHGAAGPDSAADSGAASGEDSAADDSGATSGTHSAADDSAPNSGADDSGDDSEPASAADDSGVDSGSASAADDPAREEG